MSSRFSRFCFKIFLDHIFYHIRGEKITEKSSFLTKRKGRGKDNDAHPGSYLIHFPRGVRAYFQSARAPRLSAVWKFSARTSSARFESYFRLLFSFDKIRTQIYYCIIILFYFIFICAFALLGKTEIEWKIYIQEYKNFKFTTNMSLFIPFCKVVG